MPAVGIVRGRSNRRHDRMANIRHCCTPSALRYGLPAPCADCSGPYSIVHLLAQSGTKTSRPATRSPQSPGRIDTMSIDAIARLTQQLKQAGHEDGWENCLVPSPPFASPVYPTQHSYDSDSLRQDALDGRPRRQDVSLLLRAARSKLGLAKCPTLSARIGLTLARCAAESTSMDHSSLPVCLV